MNFNELKKAVINVAMCNFVPFVRGLHGIGKSEMMLEVAEKIGELKNKEISFHTVDAAHIKEGELTGMPITGKDPDTNNLINSYTVYGLFNTIIKEAEEGIIPILFIDEINRTDRVVFNELMPIILAKRIQELYLPEELIILCAGNPEDISKYKLNDDYSVLPMDPALKDRFFIFELDVEPQTWLKWALEDNKVNIDIVDFITERPDLLHNITTKEINPTPRGWKMFSDVYSHINKTFNPDNEDLIFTVGGGKIGVETTLSFIRFLKEKKNATLKAKDFFNSDINEETFNENLLALKNDKPTRIYVSMLNITKYYSEKFNELKKLKTKKAKTDLDNLIDKFAKILFILPNDILIGIVKDMQENEKKALIELVVKYPKEITEVQKYLR